MATSKRPAGRSALAPHRVPATQPAFVLHSWDWSETSLILDLFTRTQGRVAAVAKGAKRPYSQLRAVLMPFQRIQLGLGRGAGSGTGDGEVYTLRSAEYAGQGTLLPPARLMSGFYLNELLLKLLPRADAHEALFDAYADTLGALATDDDEAPLRAFELVLLRHIGLLPQLDRDTTTQGALHPGRQYRLDAEAGLTASAPRVAERSEALLQPAHCQALEHALGQGTSAPALARLRACCQADLAALRQQVRPVLHYHLGTDVLRTRQLMLQARGLLDAARRAGTPAPTPAAAAPLTAPAPMPPPMPAPMPTSSPPSPPPSPVATTP